MLSILSLRVENQENLQRVHYYRDRSHGNILASSLLQLWPHSPTSNRSPKPIPGKCCWETWLSSGTPHLRRHLITFVTLVITSGLWRCCDTHSLIFDSVFVKSAQFLVNEYRNKLRQMFNMWVNFKEGAVITLNELRVIYGAEAYAYNNDVVVWK